MFGPSAADRYVVSFDDGSSAFVKPSTDAQTETWLRNEHAALEAVGDIFGPGVIAFDARDSGSLLVTEDLSGGYWPAHDDRVDRRPGDVDALLDTLTSLAKSTARDGLRPIANLRSPQWAHGLASGALPANGLCSAEWVDRAAPVLGRVDASAVFEPVSFVHGDVRSDNEVVVDDRAVLVDWSNAGLGNPLYDLKQLRSTLHLEGARPPWEAAEVPVDLAVRLTGGVARRVVEPRGAPAWLQQVLLRLTAINLEWLAVLLNLDPPDGRHWRSI